MRVVWVVFWVVWSIFAVLLTYQLIEIWRKKRDGRRCCKTCKYYKGCYNLHRLIDQGYPLPLRCSAFEEMDKS